VIALRSTLAVFAAVAVLVATGVAGAAESKPTAISWAKSYEQALKAALTSGKPVMLLLESKRIAGDVAATGAVLADPKVIEASAAFECARADVDKRQDLVRKYQKYTYPAVLFLDARGAVFHESAGDCPADVLVVRMKAALELLKASGELQALEARKADGTAKAEELARLGALLSQMDRYSEADEVLDEALQALPADSPAHGSAQLDKLILGTRSLIPSARDALEEWVAANPQHARRWEAQYRLGIAQANSMALAQAVKTLDEVAQGDAASDWGVLARYQAKLAAADLKQGETSCAPGG